MEVYKIKVKGYDTKNGKDNLYRGYARCSSFWCRFGRDDSDNTFDYDVDEMKITSYYCDNKLFENMNITLKIEEEDK